MKSIAKRTLLLCVILLSWFGTDGQIITTIAGGGPAGCFCYGGDNGPATAADLNHPWDVAVDDTGNVFIADNYNHCIRKVNTTGIITTIAGIGGSPGYNGDSIMATDAQLDDPVSVAVDHKGNLYIVDLGNSIIRKVDTGGIITTIAGNGTGIYAGENIPATNTGLGYPQGIVVDRNGNVLVCDTYNNRIRKVDTAGIIKTIAGTGSDGFSGDNGQATAAELFNPFRIAVDSAGALYFIDSLRVRKIDTGGIITTIAGTGISGFSGDGLLATDATFNGEQGIAVDRSGNIYIADESNSRIRKINTSGIISTIAGTGLPGFSGDNGPAVLAMLYSPTGVCVDTGGNIYLSDQGTDRIRVIKKGVGIDDMYASPARVMIYPNPSSGQCTVHVTSRTNEEVEIAITDILGKIVQHRQGHTNELISLQLDIPDGFYYAVITTGTNVETEKIMIQY